MRRSLDFAERCGCNSCEKRKSSSQIRRCHELRKYLDFTVLLQKGCNQTLWSHRHTRYRFWYGILKYSVRRKSVIRYSMIIQMKSLQNQRSFASHIVNNSFSSHSKIVLKTFSIRFKPHKSTLPVQKFLT